MRASVIIPTYNRGALIVDTLRALSIQTVSEDTFEVIVVDDGSVDNTALEVKSFIGSHPELGWNFLRHDSNRGRAAACNTGISASQYPLIIFTDDDCQPMPNWVEMHLSLHSEGPSYFGLLGAVTYPSELLRASNFVRYLNSRHFGNQHLGRPRYGGGEVPPNMFAGMNMSIPREVLFAVGLFNADIGRGQDGELAYPLSKIGIKLVFDPRPIVVHTPPEMFSLEEFLYKFSKSYRFSTPKLRKLHPGFVEKYLHWFLEAPSPRFEPVQHTC